MSGTFSNSAIAKQNFKLKKRFNADKTYSYDTKVSLPGQTWIKLQAHQILKLFAIWLSLMALKILPKITKMFEYGQFFSILMC